MRKVAQRYNIIQVGVCFFLQQQNSTFKAMPYNFYVIPDGWKNRENLVIDPSTLDFHRRNNMDFNKWIYHGIPYVNKEMDDELYQKYFKDQDEEYS